MIINRSNFEFYNRNQFEDTLVLSSKDRKPEQYLSLAKKDSTLKKFPWTVQLEQDFLDIMKLFNDSSFHSNHSYLTITQYVLPALLLGYYRIYRKEKPLGYISWGFFNTKTEKNAFLYNKTPVTEKDFTSGKNAWIVDVVAPYGHYRETIHLCAQWGKENASDGTHVKLIRHKDGKKRIGSFVYRHSKKWINT